MNEVISLFNKYIVLLKWNMLKRYKKLLFYIVGRSYVNLYLGKTHSSEIMMLNVNKLTMYYIPESNMSDFRAPSIQFMGFSFFVPFALTRLTGKFVLLQEPAGSCSACDVWIYTL